MSGMNFLEKLLDGVAVEWRTLEDVASFRRGSFPQPYGNSEWYDGEGSMPFVQVVDVLDGGFALKENTKQRISKLAQLKSVFVQEGTIIVTLQGTIGRVAVTQYDCYVDRTLAIFTNYISGINKKYFAYQLKSKFDIEKENARGSTLKTITKEEFSKFKIPIPCPDNPEKSLAIQAEIVRILDTFTALTAELTAELTDRKKQYNYYRDRLLTFEKGEVEWKPLGKLAENLDFMRKPVTSGLRDSGEVPYYGASGIVDYVKDYIFDGDFLLVSEDGANLVARNTPIAFSISGKSWVNNHAHILKFNNYVERRYVEYYLNSIDLTPYISGAAQPKLNQKNLNSIKIPNPSPHKKERIVAILDKFDTLTTSISEGLPREITLRQKQYEYYRDLLLTFPQPEEVKTHLATVEKSDE